MFFSVLFMLMQNVQWQKNSPDHDYTAPLKQFTASYKILLL
jgi:hypothetical protein